MKTITAIEFRQHLNEYLTQVQEEEIVITLDDGRLVLLFSVEPEELADEAIENDPRFVEVISSRRENYQQIGGVPFATVRQKLVDELVQDLNHADPRVRQEAIRHLAELGELVPKVNNPEA